VFDLDRKRSLLNLLQAGGLERLDKVALPGAGKPRLVIDRGSTSRAASQKTLSGPRPPP
jgi:hypothetical protein